MIPPFQRRRTKLGGRRAHRGDVHNLKLLTSCIPRHRGSTSGGHEHGQGPIAVPNALVRFQADDSCGPASCSNHCQHGDSITARGSGSAVRNLLIDKWIQGTRRVVAASADDGHQRTRELHSDFQYCENGRCQDDRRSDDREGAAVCSTPEPGIPTRACASVATCVMFSVVHTLTDTVLVAQCCTERSIPLIERCAV
jgi:hypothetical protein